MIEDLFLATIAIGAIALVLGIAAFVADHWPIRRQSQRGQATYKKAK